MADTYGLKFIKIGGISTFHGGKGGPLFRYCDLELDPMTFISELDLDMVLIYRCAKKKVFIPSTSKVTDRTDTQKNTQQKHYLSSYAGGNNSHFYDMHISHNISAISGGNKGKLRRNS